MTAHDAVSWNKRDQKVHGRTSPHEVKIENFKPLGKYAGADARPDFKRFVEETVSMLEPLNVEDAGPTHRHPWMGDFNALQWCWLLSGHSGIHGNVRHRTVTK